MTYNFPADIRERLDVRLQGGRYQSDDELIRDAIDALDQMEIEKLTRWQQRNALAELQSKQGLSRPLDDDRILTNLRRRITEEGIEG